MILLQLSGMARRCGVSVLGVLLCLLAASIWACVILFRGSVRVLSRFLSLPRLYRLRLARWLLRPNRRIRAFRCRGLALVGVGFLLSLRSVMVWSSFYLPLLVFTALLPWRSLGLSLLVTRLGVVLLPGFFYLSSHFLRGVFVLALSLLSRLCSLA